MEIRIYDNEFNFIGFVENQSSLLWHRTYNDGGDFTLTVPMTRENSDLLTMGRVIWIKGKLEAGVIESREMRQDQMEATMTIKGRFLESYLARRLTYVESYEGKTEEAMLALLENVDIPMLEPGELKEYDEEVNYQAVYKSLLETEKNLAKSSAFGFRLVPDFTEDTITFDVYKGVNHAADQYENTKVVFSEEYGNLSDVRVYENEQLYYNVVVVGGVYSYETEPESEEEDPVTVEEVVYVTVGDTESTGLERRETFCDGSDLQSKDMTREEFEAALAGKGNSALGGHSKANSFECSILPNSNFIYGKDYDLGDIVTVKKPEWGVAKNLRISEVTEVYESEIPSIEVILGTTLPKKIDW